MKQTLQMLFSFLNSSQRKKLTLLFVGLAMMGIVEMVGIASIMPFLMVLSNPDLILTHPLLASVYHAFHFTDVKYFMLGLGTLVLGVLILGNIFSSVITWFMLRFSFKQGEHLSLRLFKKYLSQPYPFYLHRHTSHLSKNIITEIDRLVVGLLFSLLQTISKALVIICIVGLLIVINPMVALASMGVLGGAYVGIYRVIRRKMIQAGTMVNVQNGFRHQLVQEVMGCIKELKVLNRSFSFCEPFQKYSEGYNKAEAFNQMLPILTRYIVEMIAFGGMVLVTLLLIFSDYPLKQFMPILGLYALAGYRLMPATQHLYANFANLIYYRPVLETIYDEMQLPDVVKEHNKPERLTFEHCLELEGVQYRYPEAAQEALHSLHLKIPLHSIIGFVGSSGAGKTTLVDIILGLLLPTQGKLSVDGKPLGFENIGAWQKNIGYVCQSIVLIDASIAENIALGIRPEDICMKAVEKAARLADLHDFIETTLPQGYQTAVGERGVRLSGGQRQRIGIARALYHDPELLIFDEATSALDNATENVIMTAIQSLAHRKTIILIAHRLNTVKDCDVIYVLENGNIVGQGSYQALLDNNPAFQILAQAV